MESLNIDKLLSYPFDCDLIMKKQRYIKRKLLERSNFIEKRIAILGGSTTADIKNVIELFLLHAGIKPSFYESEYNQYYEDGMFENEKLVLFKPDFIFIHTGIANIQGIPHITDSIEQVKEKFECECTRYSNMWRKIKSKYNCVVIQNNFELPHYLSLGNLDSSDFHGLCHFVTNLNLRFAEYARENSDFYINDIHYLSAQIGLEKWHNRSFWHAYKFAMSYDAIPLLAYNLNKIIKAILGKSKKCLVLDLDNTLWGGIIGDDGVDAIQIGNETPQAEAYTEFQKYVLALKKRGVILAVCSKNDMERATEGFSHPDSILSVDDFAVFKANWEPKHVNLLTIAEELNIGIDSIVFIDDNPVERQIIRDNLPCVQVPEVDVEDVSSYIWILDKIGCFEPANISNEDLIRTQTYVANAERKKVQDHFISYAEFLESLNMKAEIKPFKSIYLERITQLTNKTNQFNLTTKRYTSVEIETIFSNTKYITLYGRLADKFGDNGLVSVIIGEIKDNILHIDLWLMSCRVLKRGMEEAMFDQLVDQTQSCGVNIIRGYYLKTAKNNMVEDFYKNLSFELVDISSNGGIWDYHIPKSYTKRNQIILVNSFNT